MIKLIAYYLFGFITLLLISYFVFEDKIKDAIIPEIGATALIFVINHFIGVNRWFRKK
jgi:hypothetical protein